MRGTAHTFGDNIDTDQIIPARHLVTIDAAELGAACMEGADPSFASRVQEGDLIVAGRTFGCGPSREHAPLSIQGAGVAAVIAHSFARIFFRNAINLGLPLFECPGAAGAIQAGDELELDLAAGRIENHTRGLVHHSTPLPDFALEIMARGGLMKYVMAQRAVEQTR